MSKNSATTSEHPLPSSYKIYIDNGSWVKNPKQWMTKIVKTLGLVHTVEDYWRVWNYLFQNYAIQGRYNIRIFKDGILPMYEVEENKNGGKFSVDFKFRVFRKGRTEEQLFREIAATIVGREQKDSPLCGIVLSSKPKKKVMQVQLWYSRRMKNEEFPKYLRKFLTTPFWGNKTRFTQHWVPKD